MAKNFWMVVQKPEDFEITRDLGFTVHGMKGRQRRRAQRMEPDDSILFYVSGIKKWTAIAVITSRYYEDPTPIWNPADQGREVYPYRVKLRPQIVMAEDLYIDALALAPRLDYLKTVARRALAPGLHGHPAPAAPEGLPPHRSRDEANPPRLAQQAQAPLPKAQPPPPTPAHERGEYPSSFQRRPESRD